MAERPQTIDELVTGHPLAERQLRALRAVAAPMRVDGLPVFLRIVRVARALAELDAADAEAKGGA